MPQRARVRSPMLDWSGGVNEDDLPGAVQPNELRIARNVYVEGRALASRKGSTPMQTTAINSGASGEGIFELVRTQGTVRDAIAVFGTKLYKDATSATPTDITGAVTITAGQNNQVCFTHFNDLALMCNGVDNPWKWSGAGNAAALGGTPPIFGTMLAKWNRTFGAGHAAAPRTIRYTALGDPENWPAANTVAAILGDATSAIEGRDFIWQLGHLGDSIFVGLQNSTGRVLYTGDATTPFRYTQLSNFGCEGRFNYVAVGEGGYFLSTRGVHYIRPSDILITYESSLISGRRLRATWEALNKARIQYTEGTLFRSAAGNLLVVWALTSATGTKHDTLLVMDVTEGPGTERFFWWTGWDANALGVVLDATTRADRLFFTSTDGFVWQGDTGTADNTAAYIAEAATRWEDFGAPAQIKSLRDTYVEAKETGVLLNVDTSFDYSSAATLTQTLTGATQARWGTAVWGVDVWATGGLLRTNLFGTSGGHVVSFRFYTTGTNQPWAIYKVVPAVLATGEATA